jgi:hypothetical protein
MTDDGFDVGVDRAAVHFGADPEAAISDRLAL